VFGAKKDMSPSLRKNAGEDINVGHARKVQKTKRKGFHCWGKRRSEKWTPGKTIGQEWEDKRAIIYRTGAWKEKKMSKTRFSNWGRWKGGIGVQGGLLAANPIRVSPSNVENEGPNSQILSRETQKRKRTYPQNRARI